MEDRASRLAWFMEEILPHAPDLRRCVVRLGVPQPDVEDFVAEALTRAYGHHGWRGVERSRRFLLQIARNLVCDDARRRNIIRFDLHADMDALGLVDQRPSPEAAVCERQHIRIVRDAVLSLPAAYGELVRMRWSEERAVPEIAARLGLSISTVEKRLAFAIAWLRGELAARGRIPQRDPIHNRRARLPRALRRQSYPPMELKKVQENRTDL